MKQTTSLNALSKKIRRKIMTISTDSHVGHVGSSFSIVEILIALYNGIMVKQSDLFILSKGHAAPALYAVLNEFGSLTEEDLRSYCVNGSIFEEHPSHIVPGIEISTGSLGHGLSIGVGMALAARVKKEKHNVFILLSDAECDEGETWEGVLSAAHHKLENLFVFLDYNKVQAFGSTEEVLRLEPLKEKWQSFGWNVIETDGHIPQEIVSTWKKRKKNTLPTVVICHTVRGKGVGFMEHTIDWHYKDPTKEDYERAMKEL